MSEGGGGPSAAPRPGGGFNAGIGQPDEHLDEAAMMKAMQTKGLQQQQASASNAPTPPPSTQQQHAPSDMGSFTDELFVKPFEDIKRGFKDLFDLEKWLGIEPTPEQVQELERKKILLQRFNQLTDQEQMIAKQRYQERIEKQKLEEEEKQRRKQQEAQQQQQSLNMPHKAQSGPVGPGMSGNQKAKAQLDWDRQRQDSTQSMG